MTENTLSNRPLTVTICGGGNSAHVLIPLLAASNHRINLMTRRPNDWNDKVVCEMQCGLTGETAKEYVGTISKKSSDPAVVIPEADVIVLCMPVSKYRDALSRLGPHISRDKEVFVGTVYGQAGFNWMVHEMEREKNLSNVVTFAIGLIPWICRTLEYGSRAANYGGKEVNIVAVTPYDRFDRLNEIFLDDICYKPMGKGKFVQACSFLSLTLSVDNQIIHPSRCYGLWTKDGGKWDSLDEVPYFYRDFDDISADNIHKLDDDYTAVRNAVRKRFPDRHFDYMLSYLELERLTHKSANEDIKLSLKNSKQLALIKTPTVDIGGGKQGLNTECRFFTDDIQYGVLLAKWIAEKLDVKTPFIDELIFWAQMLREEHFLNADGKINKEYCLSDKFTSGIPESYGIYDIEGILD